MWGRKELQAHLREKLGIGDRQLRRLIAKRARELPSTSEQALGTLAHEAGLNLQNYLTTEQIAEVRGLVRDRPAVTPVPAKAVKKAKSTTTIKELHAGNVKVPAGALNPKHMEDAVRMAEIYSVLYAFENSMREWIDGHLTAAYGSKWNDDPKIVNTTMRGRVARNRAAEDRSRYHSRRDQRFIYYTDLGDLPDIAHSENGWKVFKPPMLPSDKWLHGRVEVIEMSRNVVAHMNPLARRDIDRIRLNFEDWLAQIKDRLH
jgi:hypothetical protein